MVEIRFILLDRGRCPLVGLNEMAVTLKGSHIRRAEALRSIPSVERILSSGEIAALLRANGREVVKSAVTTVLDDVRAGVTEAAAIDELVERVAREVRRRLAPSLRRVINATGILIHTNLGRAPIDAAVLAAAAEMLSGYTNLEFDLESGSRGHRSGHLRGVCAELFGSESAVLANNNAGATLLALAAHAAGKEVLVSRGELVEIGGAFRVPDVIQQGGAVLREVGTTNRTRASDYEKAISERTAAILRVHRSNFDIVGFTEQPEIAELVAISRKHAIPLIYDEGSGRVVDLERYGLRRSETVRELIELGVDVVTCSTDKLVGATQGGLILGRAESVARCASHPLMRALRAGKESYAVVSATLQAFLTGTHETTIPIYRMAAFALDDLRARASMIAAATAAEVVATEAAFGGGTTPTETFPSIGVALGAAERRHRALLANEVPVVGRIEADRLILDLRTVDPADDDVVTAALQSAEG